MAADRGVRIHVVGLGTPAATAAAMGDGMAMYLQLDEPTLREVAQMTGGDYHQAGTAEALRGVYQNLGSRLQTSKRDTELTALLAWHGGPGAGGRGGAVGAVVRAHCLTRPPSRKAARCC
jgi:Ca-activated chloride channel family protein